MSAETSLPKSSTLDESAAECLVFTFKEGILASVAHDLQIRVGKMRIQIERTPDRGAGAEGTDGPGEALRIDAVFFADSLRVVGAVRSGKVDASLLSQADHQKIERTLSEEILKARRYPEIRFCSTEVKPSATGYEIRGELSLLSTTRPITLRSVKQGGKHVAEVMLHQPEFGIKPYSAMLGALKIQEQVRVQVRIPMEGT